MMSFASVSTSSLIGVGIACTGNVLISLALTVQKLAHRRQNEELLASRSRSHSPEADDASSQTEVEERVGLENGHEGRKDDEHGRDMPTQGVEAVAVPVLVVPEDQTAETQRDEDTSDANVNGHKKPSTLRIRIDPQATMPRRSKHTLSQSQSKSNGSRSHNSGDDAQEEQEEESPVEVEEGMYLKSKMWWLGLVLMACGEGGNFLSYGFAPASVVAPLGTVALIANCVFAPVVLGETFYAKELIGMALAIVGAVTVVWSSSSSNPRLDPDELLNALTQLPFVIYTLLNIILAVILLFLSGIPRFENRFIVVDVGICALFGGYTVLSTKALSSLLSSMFLNAFAKPITWGLLVVLVATSVLQVKYLNRALMRFQSKEVIPTQFVFFSLAAIIGSAVLYQEFRDVPFSRFVNFAFGIATTFLGVHLLTSFSEQTDEEDAETDETDVGSLADSASRPSLSRRATSTTSLNLLLPTSSRISERTPLIVPVVEAPEGVQGVSTPGYGGSLTGRRIIKRTSTGDFTATLGISSQAGFLLMATTPPSQGGNFGRRDRSASRSAADYTPIIDEERAVGGVSAGAGAGAGALGDLTRVASGRPTKDGLLAGLSARRGSKDGSGVPSSSRNSKDGPSQGASRPL